MSILRKLMITALAAGTLIAAPSAALASAGYAGTASQQAAPSAKTLSAVAGNAAKVDCIAHTKKTADHNHERLVFFYNPGGCIGTVIATAYGNIAHVCITTAELRIYSGSHRDVKAILHFKTPICDTKVVTNWQVHHSYHNPITVCVRSATTTGGRLGPACATVNK
jgi:hypothetical protein